MAFFKGSGHDYYIIPELERKIERLVEKIEGAAASIHVHRPKTRRRQFVFLQKMGETLLGIWKAPMVPPLRMPKLRLQTFGTSFSRIELPQFSGHDWAKKFWGLSKNAIRISLFSLFFFAIGFFAINGEAYSKIMKAWLIQYEPFAASTIEETKKEVTPVAIQKDPVQPILRMESSVNQKNLLKESSEPTMRLKVLPPDSRLIIPRLNKNVPIVFSDPEKLISADWESLEKTFQDDLKNGVIHYPGTAEPGEKGNVFITGHSSYYPWDDGRYKDVFVLLHTLKPGDEILVQHEGKEYRYKIEETKNVKNNDVSVLDQNGQTKTITLMTCSPVGTNIRRLVVVGAQL